MTAHISQSDSADASSADKAATSQAPASGVAADHKTCLHCGQLFERPGAGRNIQQASIWKRRMYCCRGCSNRRPRA